MTKPLILVALVTLTLSSCSGERPRGDARPAPPAPGTASTSVLAVPSVSFAEHGPPVDLGGGWTANRCEGDAPVVCVSLDGQHAGIVELAVFPVASMTLPGFREAVAGGDVPAAMEVIAGDFVRVFRRDRSQACGDDYRISATPRETTTVLGRIGLRYGYVGRRGGVVVERQVNHGTIDGDEVVLVNASAYAEGGCVPPEREFDPDTLLAFEPRLRALVAAASR